MADASFDLERFPVHLGRGARVVRLPEMTGEMSWYEDYGSAHSADGAEGRLVAIFSFTEPWSSWEVHPEGEELVVCLSGRITLHQEVDGEAHSTELGPGQALVNPKGVWHTADTDGPASALFVTAGKGTQHRPR